MSYQNIIAETKGRVGIIRFNRPAALNALNAALVLELNAAIDACEADTNIGFGRQQRLWHVTGRIRLAPAVGRVA